MIATGGGRPVIERLTIRNYRVLRDATFAGLSPLTVLFGPNGSGKSTVFDVFAFLNEAFTTNLRRAWDRRNRLREIRSRGAEGPVEFELKYRESRGSKLVTYKLAIDEERGAPVVLEETLRWSTAPGQGRSRDTLRGPQERLSQAGDNLPSSIVGIEEPENQLHPRLLPLLAQEAREAAARSQMLVTTHSPFFADSLQPKELWVLYREADGSARMFRASKSQRLIAMVENGALLGSLWTEGYFDAGDPLVRSGRPA